MARAEPVLALHLAASAEAEGLPMLRAWLRAAARAAARLDRQALFPDEFPPAEAESPEPPQD